MPSDRIFAHLPSFPISHKKNSDLAERNSKGFVTQYSRQGNRNTKLSFKHLHLFLFSPDWAIGTSEYQAAKIQTLSSC